MNLPWTIYLPGLIQVTKLMPDGLGGTDVEADYNGTSFKPFKIDKDVSIVGIAVLADIQCAISAQVHEALRLNQ